jgi:hypothetical protein
LMLGHIAQAAWFRISNKMEVTRHISKAIATSNHSLKVFCLSTFHINSIPYNLITFDISRCSDIPQKIIIFISQ